MNDGTNFISTSSIIKTAGKHVEKYFNEMGWTSVSDIMKLDFRVDIQEFYDSVIYPEYEYDLVTSEDLESVDGDKVLGKTLLREKVILLDRSLSIDESGKIIKDSRFTFTFGHEIGHGVLHPTQKELFRCTKDTMKKKDPLEIQANIYSQFVIMPDVLVKIKFSQCFDDRRPFIYKGQGFYWFEAWGGKRRVYITSFDHYAKAVAESLVGVFSGISKGSMAVKLVVAGLIHNHTEEKFTLAYVPYSEQTHVSAIVEGVFQ